MRVCWLLVLFAVGVVIAQQCPGCKNQCWKNCDEYSADYGKYECVDPKNLPDRPGQCYGTRRKCVAPKAAGCNENSSVDDPSKCCDGVAFIKIGSVLECVTFQCDKSSGCSSAIQCVGDNAECIDGKCISEPEAGVHCGGCGKAPIGGRCCAPGIFDGKNGKCFCYSQGVKTCTNDIDCDNPNLWCYSGKGGGRCCPMNSPVDGDCRRQSL